MLKSLELFAGAGGLALGTELAGFHAVAAVEKDKWACETLEENRARGYPLVKDLRVICGDVRNLDYSAIPTNLDLISVSNQMGIPRFRFQARCFNKVHMAKTTEVAKNRAYDDTKSVLPAEFARGQHLSERPHK